MKRCFNTKAWLKAILVFLVVSFSCSLRAQVNAKKSLEDSVLFRTKIKGYVHQVYTWKDILGTNHLVLAEAPARVIVLEGGLIGQEQPNETITNP